MIEEKFIATVEIDIATPEILHIYRRLNNFKKHFIIYTS